MPRSSSKRNARSAKKIWLGIEPLESRVLLTAIPTGNVDVFNRTQIVGWAYDPDDGATAINVNITINGSTTTIPANAARTDLIPYIGSAYHGFSYTVPTLAPGSTPITITAVSASTGATKTLLSSALVNPAPSGWLNVHSNTQIAGWAFDSDSTSPIQIRIDINGVAGTPFTTNVARPDLASLTADPTPGFNITGNFAGEVVEVYTIDAPSGQAVLLWTNNKLPTGWVDVNDAFQVSGWAVDPDNTSASINVQVDLDGAPISGSPATASLNRPDLTATWGSANHGFSALIPGMTPGSHTISVYAIDGQANSAAPVLIGSRTFYNSPPVGNVDVVNASVIKGWALDPDLGAAPATVKIYVDDELFTTIPANQSRPDLTKTYGSPNHGFTVDLSSLPAGSHAISVTAVDNRVSDESNIVIYDGFINNHQPIGYVDSTANNTVSGWAQTPDTATGSIPVDIYVDGAYSETTTANLSRPDLVSVIGSANHGFSIALLPMTFGTHKIEVYAAESQGNLSTLIGTSTINNTRPTGWLNLVNSTALAGWAYDANSPTASLAIQVYINGTLAVSSTANLTRNDLTASLGSPNHGFSITLPTLNPGSNEIDIYALDPNNNMISIIKTTTIVI